MISVGESAREIREQFGLSQKDAAVELGISNVHLCNVENNNSNPSPELLAKYRELWGIDLYVFAWCRKGDVAGLPRQLQTAAKSLSSGWQQQIDKQINKRRTSRR
jgi:transcriptional regulator with XRE-family HTH domain